MADIRVEQYKKGVERAVDRWKEKLKKTGEKAAKLRDALAKLKAIKEPTADDKKKMADLEKGFSALNAEVDKATLELKLDVMLLDVPKEAPKADLIKLPEWLKALIKAKGIPLGNGVSIAPDVDFDFKAFKLKSLGVKVKW